MESNELCRFEDDPAEVKGGIDQAGACVGNWTWDITIVRVLTGPLCCNDGKAYMLSNHDFCVLLLSHS